MLNCVKNAINWLCPIEIIKKKMNKAIFIDRDGVLCKEKNMYNQGTPITRPEHFEWIPEAKEALAYLSKLEYLLVLTTNQPLINQGLITLKDFYEINKPIYEELNKHNKELNVYFCPHIPKENCVCRKPRIGMLLNAKKELDIAFHQSYIIGDKTCDIQAGKNAGCKTILVLTGYGGKDNQYVVKPDYTINNLLELKGILK